MVKVAMLESYQEQLRALHQRIMLQASSSHGANVYVNNLQARRQQALMATFPVVSEQLPANIFGAISTAYAKYYPSDNWDINLYGRQFPEFLAAQVHSAKAALYSWGFIAALAHVENYLRLAYYCDADADFGFLGLESNNTDFSPEALAQTFKEKHPYAYVVSNHGHNSVAQSKLRLGVIRQGGKVVLTMSDNNQHGLTR